MLDTDSGPLAGSLSYYILHLNSSFWAEALPLGKRRQAFPESGLRLSFRMCCQGLFLREQLLAKGGEVLIMTEAWEERRGGAGQYSFREKVYLFLLLLTAVSCFSAVI